MSENIAKCFRGLLFDSHCISLVGNGVFRGEPSGHDSP